MNRREWATTLGAICSPSFPVPAIEAIVDMLPLLEEFPDSMFSVETVKEIGASKRRQSAPSYDEIITIFRTKFRDKMHPSQRMGANPPQLSITHHLPDLRAPSPEESAYVDRLVASFKAEVAARETVKQREGIPPRYLHGLELSIARKNANIPLSRELAAILAEYEVQR